MSDPRLPDDWDSYHRTCVSCGERYHASEGACECEADQEEGGAYEVVVINPEGPGRVLEAFDELDAAYDWADSVAHDYPLGVAVHDTEDDTYDCEGEGEFLPAGDCWTSS